MVSRWSIDERDGELLVLTEREGPAARVGHRLTLVMTRWRAEVQERHGVLHGLRMRIDLSGLQVREGHGGLKPLSFAERELARRQALRALRAKHHPSVDFETDRVSALEHGYDLDGRLRIAGETRPRQLRVHEVADGRVTCSAEVSQSAHGLTPVSFMMGALRVSDVVTVRFSARRPAP